MRALLVVAAALILIPFASCKRAAPANVAASVNNRPITNADLDKQYQRFLAQSGAQQPGANDDAVQIQKLELLRNMVDAEIMLQRAEKGGLLAVDADVEAKFNELKAPFTQEEFQRQLNAQKMTVDDVKAQLRRDLSIQKLLNKEITSHINISERDISDFYKANQATFNLAEPQIHMAQIMVTPNPDPAVKNLRNDKAQNEEQARQKALMLESRIRKGEDFAMLAQNFSEDPASAASGGDLGYIQESALERASPELRKLVMSMQPGQVSGVIRTPEGYRILKVISKEPAGQRDLNDPKVQQMIRETLMNRKDQLLKAAYYEVARNEAEVVNYLARQVIERRTQR
jgi:peptidyl-prolyl cis-trans isomerase SurA